MTTVILDHEPSVLVAGAAAAWKKEDSDYTPSDGYVLMYYFRGNTAGASFNVVAETSDSGDYWEATITSAKTQGLPAGAYGWQAQISDGTNKHVIGSGVLTLQADLADTSAPYDPRSQVKRTLDAINDVIAGRATSDTVSYSIAGRSLTKMSPADLIALQSHYAQLYAQELREEQAVKGNSPFRNFKVKFRDAQ